jgi:hypothetical protein
VNDTIELKLPVSGKTASIRNYTTRNDDHLASEVLYSGVSAKGQVGGGSANLDFPLANVMSQKDVYVERLVISIDGNSENIKAQLGELRSPDYDAIVDAVDKIVDANSPKVKAENTASKQPTKKI